jgi:2-polyprenyl-3-methyl-5-hydroxy-6-metoxy-1,4-benzoquinol methylase
VTADVLLQTATRPQLVVEREVLRACPLCDAVRWERWRTGYDRSHLISQQRFEYARCLSCAVVFERVRPPEHEAERFYPTTYYGPRAPAEARRLTRAARGLARVNRSVARRLPDSLPARLRAAYVPPRRGAVLLDYGCGSSTVLDGARARGWATVGADISDRVLSDVRAKGHLSLAASTDGLEELADRSLALVRLNHVIEHLYRPKEVLSLLARKLESGGVLHVATPNPESWGARIFHSCWIGLDCPRHVVLYPPPTLGRLLLELGFTRVEMYHEVLTKDIARSIGHLLHALGALPHSRILSMADRQWPELVLDVPARLAAYRGASDRFHCFATK